MASSLRQSLAADSFHAEVENNPFIVAVLTTVNSPLKETTQALNAAHKQDPASLEKPNADGNTALMIAAQHGHDDAIEAFLNPPFFSRRQVPHLETKKVRQGSPDHDYTALDFLIAQEDSNKALNPLIEQQTNKRRRCIMLLADYLLSKRADLNPGYYVNACAHGNIFFLERYLNPAPHFRLNEGDDPEFILKLLETAITHNRRELLNFLISKKLPNMALVFASQNHQERVRKAADILKRILNLYKNKEYFNEVKQIHDFFQNGIEHKYPVRTGLFLGPQFKSLSLPEPTAQDLIPFLSHVTAFQYLIQEYHIKIDMPLLQTTLACENRQTFVKFFEENFSCLSSIPSNQLDLLLYGKSPPKAGEEAQAASSSSTAIAVTAKTEHPLNAQPNLDLTLPSEEGYTALDYAVAYKDPGDYLDPKDPSDIAIQKKRDCIKLLVKSSRQCERMPVACTYGNVYFLKQYLDLNFRIFCPNFIFRLFEITIQHGQRAAYHWLSSARIEFMRDRRIFPHGLLRRILKLYTINYKQAKQFHQRFNDMMQHQHRQPLPKPTSDDLIELLPHFEIIQSLIEEYNIRVKKNLRDKISQYQGMGRDTRAILEFFKRHPTLISTSPEPAAGASASEEEAFGAQSSELGFESLSRTCLDAEEQASRGEPLDEGDEKPKAVVSAKK